MNKLVLLALSFVWISPAFAQQEDTAWVVRRLEWTAEDEENYSTFVRALGQAKCYTVNDCIRSPANPYADTDPVGVKFWSDCADFPYFLRAYFAWKNNLPFGYINQVDSFDDVERRKHPPVLKPGEKLKPIDLRYSEMGNFPVARTSLVPRERTVDFIRETNRMQDIVSSAMLRMGPNLQAKIESDFYSPALKPGSIRPGTAIYDPNGHVAVVYDVLPDGRLLYFDAHPDNSVTHGVFTSKFARSRPPQGAGFKNFRPVRLVGAAVSWWGSEYTGGKLVYAKDSEIPDFSPVQYFGTNPDATDWTKGTFTRNGKTYAYHEYVRLALASEKLNPVNELLSSLQEICEDLKERADSVDAAVKAGLPSQPHPTALPANIFGADGDWESYSTPSRDARLRTQFLELRKNAQERYNQWLKDDFTEMSYSGADLRRDFLLAFHKVNNECRVAYKNTAGKTVQLSFELAIRRLFRLSFDPYFCPELRWGASHPDELKTCAASADQMRWYNAEQSLRNKTTRDWSSPKPITIDLLESGQLGAGAAPDVDLRQFLQSLPTKGVRP